MNKTAQVPHNNLEAFLYILLRDHVTSGILEAIMEQHVEGTHLEVTYSNEFGYAMAKDLAGRLR